MAIQEAYITEAVEEAVRKAIRGNWTVERFAQEVFQRWSDQLMVDRQDAINQWKKVQEALRR